MATPDELKRQQQLEESTRNIKSLVGEILDTKKLITDDDIKRAKVTRDIAKEMGTTYATAKQFLSIKEKEKSYAEQLQDLQREEAINNSERVKNSKDLLEKYQKRIEREKEIDDWTGKWKEKWEDFWEIAQDPKIAGGLFLISLTAETAKFAGSLKEMGESMGLSASQAMSLGPSMLSANIQGAIFGIGMKQTSEAMAGLAEGAGNLKGLTGEAAAEAAKLAFTIGLTEQETGKLLARNMLVTGETMAQSKASLETVANLARGAKLPIGKVMKDVADNMDMMAQFGTKTVEELGKAAVEANKMGASLSQVAAFGEKIMDLDNARNSAMQLSVLLGRNINISRAQQLMYAGKETESYKEMLNQLGGITAFNKMDYYQRQAAADMMGVSTGELQKQLNLAAGLTETGEKQAEGWAKNMAWVQKMGEYWKENGTFIASAVNAAASLKQLNVGRYIAASAHWVKEKAHMIWKASFGGGGAAAAAGPLTKAGKPDMRFKANKGLIGKMEKPLDGGNKLTAKMDKVPAKKGNAISRFFNSFKTVSWGSVFKAVTAMALMGVALLFFVPPFKLLADVPIEGTLAGIATLLALTMAMKVMGKATGNIIQGSIGLMIMGAALIPAAFAFKMIAGVDMGSMWNFAGVLTVLGLAFALIGMLGTLPVGALGLLLMAPAMIMAAISFKMMQGIPMGEIWNFAAVLTVLGLAFSGIGYLATLPIGAIGLLLMAPAMILAAVAFKMIAGTPMDEMWNFVGVLSALGLAFALIGMLPTIFIGAAGLMMLSIAMIPAAFAFSLIAGVPIDSMVAFAGLLPMLGLAFAMLGFVAPFVIAGSVAMIVAAGAMTVFGLALSLMPKDLMQGEQMLLMAAGMGAMGVAGVSMLLGTPGFFAMSLGLVAFAGALLLIKPLLPVVEKLAQLGLIGDMEGAAGAKGGEDEGGGENEVVAKLDEMISILKKGGKVIIDGKVAGKVVNMASGPVGT